MDTMETIASNNRVNQRRQGLSWSLSFRSSTRKRSGIVRPPTPPPTCEERVHYPVFNPHDPRHNPTAIPPSWIRGSYSLSEDSSSTHTSGRWHSLSERSLRKARSGLDAIRSGMHRRPSVDQRGPRRDLPGLWMSTDSRRSSINRPDSSFPSTISEASTDDEFEFGTDLYRTRPNGSSTWNLEIVNRYLNEIGSSHALPHDVYTDVDIGPAGSRLEGETLNNLSEEDSEVTRLPSKTQTIRWDDRVQSGRKPSITSTSSSFISSRASTRSDESILSQLINATQAFEALCASDEPTKKIPDGSDVECNADDSLPATSRGSTEVLPKGAASQSNGSTGTNSEEADNQSRSDHGETPADKPSRETSRASSMNASGGNNSSTSQGNRSRHSTCQSDSTARTSRTQSSCWTRSEGNTSTLPTSYNQSRRSTVQSGGSASAAHTSWSNVSSPVEHDDVLSLPPTGLGDEYLGVDAKSNGFNPDQGAAIKSEQAIIHEENIGSTAGFGIHRSSLASAHTDSQMNSPIYAHDLDRQPSTRSRKSIDSTDDCFLTYAMFQRQYFS